jgi:hypothetical protein
MSNDLDGLQAYIDSLAGITTPETETPVEEPVNAFVEGEKQLREGVRVLSNGRYFEDGKGFIKKEDAFV